MSEWTDMMNLTATLKKRIDAVMSTGQPTRAYSTFGTGVCRCFPVKAIKSDTVMNRSQRVDIYMDVDTTTSKVGIGDVITVNGIDHQVISVRNIGFNEEVFNFETFSNPLVDQLG